MGQDNKKTNKLDVDALLEAYVGLGGGRGGTPELRSGFGYRFQSRDQS